MKAPLKKGMRIDGQVMDLEHFLLNHSDRPIPPPPTHYVVVEVLNTDLSIKRVAIYFNPDDTWQPHYGGFGENNPKAVGMNIGNGLAFLSKDPNTLAYKFWIMSVDGNQIVHKGSTKLLTKCGY